MTSIRATLILSALFLMIGGPALAGENIVNPLVTTDRSVDTSSVERMVATLIKPGMTEQEKALAIYNYVRRTMFHYRTYPKYGGGGAMNLINGVGYCLCTPTAGAECELLEAAGIKACILDTPGHGSVVAKIDGEWHWLDAFLGGCVYNEKRTALTTLPDIIAHPALLKRENPSPVPLLPCIDLLYADSLRFEPDNTKYHSDCAPDDFAWAAKATPGSMTPTYWTSSMKLDITLRPGESYAREWDGQKGMYFLHNTQERFAPPHHFCGIDAEQRDTINWPYFKPYLKEITSFDPNPKVNKKVTVKTGRYWANGTLRWSPRMNDLGTFSRTENVKIADGKIVLADASKPGTLELAVRCPYMLVGGKLIAQGERGVAFSISPNRNVGDKSPGESTRTAV